MHTDNLATYFHNYPVFEKSFCEGLGLQPKALKLPVPILFASKIQEMQKKGDKLRKKMTVFIDTEDNFYRNVCKNDYTNIYASGLSIVSIIFMHSTGYQID